MVKRQLLNNKESIKELIELLKETNVEIAFSDRIPYLDFNVNQDYGVTRKIATGDGTTWYGRPVGFTPDQKLMDDIKKSTICILEKYMNDEMS